MKKIFTLFFAMFMAFISVNAQNLCEQKNYVGHSRFFDNTSIGLYGGVQTNLHDWNNPQGAVTGLTLNKELTPTFGLTLEGGLGWNNLGNWFVPAGHLHNSTAVDNVNVMLLGRTNLFNLFGGYKVRVFNIETVLGAGYSHNFGEAKSNDLLGKGGFNFNFNLGKQKAWTLTVQPAVLFNLTNRAPYAKMTDKRAVGQLTASLTYHFKTSNGTHHALNPVLYDCDEVNELKGMVDALAIQNAELQTALAQKPTEVVVTETVYGEPVVYEILPKVQFLVNSAVVPETSMANLMDVAESMKESEDNYILNGYASVEGPEQFNQTLSLERAEAVKAVLVNYGVNPDKLEVIGNGPTEEFGNDYAVNRVVTFAVEDKD